MYGGRITSEERSALSTYVGVGIAIVLIAGALYTSSFSRRKRKRRPQVSIRTGPSRATRF
jgi:hypothetical protein